MSLPSLSRRRCLFGLLAGFWFAPLRAAEQPVVDVWKDPNCGCCTDWIRHLEAAGFQVRVHPTGNASARRRLGVPEALASCHTALLGGYFVEGHVPATELLRLLAEKPAVAGIAVPGMPIGSPGMDGPAYRGRRDPYSVLLVERDGRTRVYRRYG